MTGPVTRQIVLWHIYLYCSAMTVFMYQHPESAPVIAPTVGGLLGLTHWFVKDGDGT